MTSQDHDILYVPCAFVTTCLSHRLCVLLNNVLSVLECIWQMYVLCITDVFKYVLTFIFVKLNAYTIDQSPIITYRLYLICRSQWPRGLNEMSSPLEHCDRGFKFHSRHGCLSAFILLVLSYVGIDLAGD
jgi:hypothetical protein